MRPKKVSLLGGLLGLALASRVEADPLAVYTFTGTLTRSVCDRSGQPCPSLAIGDSFTGTMYYSYDTHPVDVTPSDPTVGDYRADDEFSIIYSIALGQAALSSSPVEYLRIQDAAPLSLAWDVFRLTDYRAGSPVPCQTCGSQLDLFFYFSPDAFSNDLVPILDVSKFTGGNLYLTDSASFDVWGTINSVTSARVPEPATLLMVATGFVAVVIRRRPNLAAIRQRRTIEAMRCAKG